MGSVFSSSKYSADEHGVSDRALFESYVTDENKFSALPDKVVAITGTSAGGMGYYLAEIALRKQCKVLLLLNRDSGSAKKGQEGLEKLLQEYKGPTQIQAVTCDMQDLESVKNAAETVNQVAKKHGGLDILICNAGIMATRDKRTAAGLEVQMQTNQLSHFLLTQMVWPSIQMAADKRGDARIVTHSSSARDTPSAKLQQKYFVKSQEGTLGGDKTWFISEFVGYEGPWSRYHQTKLANACFSMELHNKLQAKGITNIKSMTADPGLASSNLQVNSTRGDGLMSDWLAKLLAPNGHSAEDGSLSVAMCAFSPEADSGDMYMPEKMAAGPPMKCIAGNKPVKKGGEKLTCDAENQANVWQWCEDALEIKFEI